MLEIGMVILVLSKIVTGLFTLSIAGLIGYMIIDIVSGGLNDKIDRGFILTIKGSFIGGVLLLIILEVIKAII